MALVKFGSSRIMEISENSKVARPDVYPTLRKLRQLALVEKIISTPPEYRAIPMKECLSTLLEAKRSQYQKIEAETEILQGTIKTEPAEGNHKENPQFILVPQQKVVDRIGASIEKTQKSIDAVLSWKRFSRAIVGTLGESIEKAWAKRVKIRLIVEKPPKNKTAEQLVQYFRQKPFAQLRFISYHPDTIFGVYDRKEVSMMTLSRTDLQGSPGLWSTNDALISLGRKHFETLWHQSA